MSFMPRSVTGGRPDGDEVGVLRHARHVGEDLRAGAEAVAAVPLLRFDRLARRRCAAWPSTLRSSRRPVALDASGLVNQSFG